MADDVELETKDSSSMGVSNCFEDRVDRVSVFEIAVFISIFGVRNETGAVLVNLFKGVLLLGDPFFLAFPMLGGDTWFPISWNLLAVGYWKYVGPSRRILKACRSRLIFSNVFDK
jgi:hypothetical protein